MYFILYFYLYLFFILFSATPHRFSLYALRNNSHRNQQLFYYWCPKMKSCMLTPTNCEFLHYCWQQTFWKSFSYSNTDTKSRKGYWPNASLKILCSRLIHTSFKCQFSARIFNVTQVYVINVVVHCILNDVLNQVQVVWTIRKWMQIGSNENHSRLLTRWVTGLATALCSAWRVGHLETVQLWRIYRLTAYRICCFIWANERHRKHFVSVAMPLPKPTFGLKKMTFSALPNLSFLVLISAKLLCLTAAVSSGI